MVQDVPLARALYKACEIGQEIPPELYGAVARVLAFVMTLKAKGAAAGCTAATSHGRRRRSRTQRARTRYCTRWRRRP